MDKLFIKIKTAKDIETKVKEAQDIFIKTKILIEGNALSYFDDNICASEKNYLKKFLEYKDKKGLYANIDCDVSIMCVALYQLLNDKISVKDIKQQNRSTIKYEILSSLGRYKGDTMTSAITILKQYLGCLWKSIDKNSMLLLKEKYRRFHALFDTVSSNDIPIAKKGEWIDYCKENCNVIWNAISDECKIFLHNYFMFGNYMCIPGESYRLTDKKTTSFNMSRSKFGKWDTIDTLLIKIYQYFDTNDKSYLESIFTVKQSEIADETIKWFNNFEMNSWPEFIHKNYLEDFVNKSDLKPISMKTGRVINSRNCKTYNPMPSDMKEYNRFFKEVSTRIYKRSERILNTLNTF